MENDKRKALKKAYMEKPVVGGICCIRCSGNGRMLIQPTVDVESLRNRFNFGLSMKGCPHPSLRREYEQYGGDAFTFEVLEELAKRKDETDREFREDIDALYEIWLEKTQVEKPQ